MSEPTKTGSPKNQPLHYDTLQTGASAGFGFFARGHHWVGVVLEAFPGFYSDRTTFGMSTILQWQYY